MKRCYKCGEEKPTTEFNKNREKADGLQGICRECSKARNREWYARNSLQKREYQKEWRKNNAEHVRKYDAQYRIDNLENLREKDRAYARKRDPEKHKAGQIKWRSRNKEHIRRYNRRWIDANPIKKAAQTRNREARLAGAEGTHTYRDIEHLRNTQIFCPACGEKFAATKKSTVDHIIPISRGGKNSPENLMLLCRECNSAKHDLLPEEYAKRLENPTRYLKVVYKGE